MAEMEPTPNPPTQEPSSNPIPSLAQPAITPITSLPTTTATTTTNTTNNNNAPPLPDSITTSQAKRPRDARLMHLVLASLGISGYQERVPLQLLDFTYRYTSSVLTDALYLNAEGYTMASGADGPKNAGRGGAGAGGGATDPQGSVSLNAVRLSIASRLKYQFNQSLPKEFLMELAAERNRVALPPVGREWGVRLPPERYCLTGVGWGVKEEWESEGEEVEKGEQQRREEGDTLDAEGEGEGGDTRMEDIFGEELGDGDAGGGGGRGGDRDMMDG